MRIVLVVASFLLVACQSCSHTSIPKPLADFGVCVGHEVSPQVQSCIADVETALASGNASALIDLAGRLTWTVVDCAVHEILPHARERAKVNDQLGKITTANAESWLASHKLVARPGDGSVP